METLLPAKQEQAMRTLKEQARFYISNPTKAAEALLFVKALENYCSEIKEKVKERSAEIMDREESESIEYSVTDPETGEIRTWEIKRSYATTVKEYRVEGLLEALDEKEAIPFLKVSKTTLDRYMKKALSKGTMTMEQADIITRDPKISTKKGSGVVMREVKA